jgi:hypothetical protein
MRPQTSHDTITVGFAVATGCSPPMFARDRIAPLFEAQHEARIELRPRLDSADFHDSGYASTPPFARSITAGDVERDRTAGNHPTRPPFGATATPGHEHSWYGPTMEELSTTIGDIRRPTKAVGLCARFGAG